MPSELTSRRGFITSATALSTAASASRVTGAADRIRIALIGAGGRGQYLMKELNRIGGIQWVAVCDVYDVRRAQAAKAAGSPVEQYLDYRQILERKDVDAVVIATPDHWHAPIAVEALRAGKDVYVEKPMVHNPHDGLAIVKAVRENRRVLQVGTQGRGLPQFVEAKQRFIDTGAMGKVGLARTWYTSNQGYVKIAPPGFDKKPEGLDWERWLGPAPKTPWNPEIYFSPYKWLYYDGGMIMGIAIHVLDSAHHWLGIRKPKAAMTGGGIYFYKDGRDTPDVVSFILDYPEEVTLTFTAECLTCPDIKTSAGVELRGTGGVLWAERYVKPGETAVEYLPNSKFSRTPAYRGPGSGATAEFILRNWLECIRSRRSPVANEVEGHYSCTACYMALQSYLTRSRVVWNPAWDLPA